MSERSRTFLISLLIAALVIILSLSGWLERLELLLIDLRMRVFSRAQATSVALVAMDQNSMKELGVWPIPRNYHGDVLRNIHGSGARAVLMDFNFATPSQDPGEDARLVRAVSDSGPVVLPVQMEERQTVEGALVRNVVLPFPELEEVATALGATTLTLDRDDVVRRMPSAVALGDRVFQPLGVVGARLIDPSLPTGFPRGACINMSFGTLQSIPVVPFIDVLRGDFDGDVFRDRIVLIGATSEDLHDFWMTSIGVIPGVYIQAAVLETALNRSWYLSQGKGSSALAVVVASLILGPLLGRAGWRAGSAVLTGYLALLVLASLISFRGALLMDMMPLIALGVIQLPVQMGLHARKTEQVLELERRKTSAILQMSDLREAEGAGRDPFAVPLVLLRQTLDLDRISLFLREEEGPGGWSEKVVIGGDKTGADEKVLGQAFEEGEVVRLAREGTRPVVYVPLMTVRKTVGVLYAEGSPSFQGSEEDIALLLSFATITAYFLESSELDERVKSLYVNSIKAITKALDSKDHYTSAHSELSLDYVEKFGRACGLAKEQIEVLHVGALLHDIGKIGVPDNILTKAGKLTGEEYSKIKEHALTGYEIIKDMPFPEEVKLIVRGHHERFDGTGYPDGLKGEQIHPRVRVFSIIDVFETMIGQRPYRKAVSLQEAKGEIERHAGTQFDPELVRIFLALV
ncbi:MAG: CHASE2 domain-containing protein [bacterium]|nr:MAG: CHASE2 domain-containing protein [bacterium]